MFAFDHNLPVALSFNIFFFLFFFFVLLIIIILVDFFYRDEHQGLYIQGCFSTWVFTRFSLMKAGEMAQVVKNISCSCRETRFDSQNPHDG